MSHGLALPGDVDDVVVEAPPLVLLNVCDSYLRRNEGQERVIGTLLGTLRGNVVVVKNSYAVPHNESDEQVGQEDEPKARAMRREGNGRIERGRRTETNAREAGDPWADHPVGRWRTSRWPWTSISTAPCSSSTNA